MRTIVRAAIAAAALAFVYLSYCYLTLPDVRALAHTNPETTAFMQLRVREAEEAGRTLRVRHQWVPEVRISENLRRAVLVAEDSAFFEHDGLDLAQIRLALEESWEEGRFTRGASTITQQLAKNLYLSPSRNPVRKLKEVLIARRLEAALTKRRILEVYLNTVEWGDGIFGCEAAARAYFGKAAAALSPAEAAMLAGALINPRAHNPSRPTARLRSRQALILRRMGIAPQPRETITTAPPSELSTPPQPPSSPDVDPITLAPMNVTPPAPPGAVHSVQPVSGNGESSPSFPKNL